MRRPLAAWGIAFALGAGGWLSAHALAYRIVGGEGHHGRLLHETGHSYLAYAPTFVLLCGVLAFACLAALCARVAREGGRVRLPVAALGLVPPLAFVVQEHLERVLHEGGGPLATVAEPVFVVGLLLQFPFALAAVLVGRLLLAVLEAVVRTSGGRPIPLPRAARALLRPAECAALLRPALVASGGGQRAPPLPQ